MTRSPTVEFVPITAEMIETLAAQSGPEMAALARNAARMIGAVDLTHARVCLVDGVPVGAGGITVAHRGTGEDGLPCGFGDAWVLIATPVPIPMRAWQVITTRCIEELDLVAANGVRCIELTVDPRNEAALRWARRMGFAPQGWRRGWGVTGTDFILMARVRKPGAVEERKAA